MKEVKHIALVAHDHCKNDLAEWVKFNKGTLKKHFLYSTGTTGKVIRKVFNGDDINITLLKSGPLGGDQQLGSMIAEGKIDVVIFFNDPLSALSHDVDVKALLRICVLYNIPTACNRSTADFIISSNLFEGEYDPIVKNYDDYLDRKI